MSVLGAFSPPVATWFTERFAAPTEPQVQGWAEIKQGHDTLIMAPTGSGKTLAAFLAGIDALVGRAQRGELDDKVRIVYVSPLKALGADVERNLEGPLREIEQVAARLGRLLPPLRTAVRSGDTTPAERQKMLRRPPHVLITTPESLYLLLTAQRGRQILVDTETVIVDEIHALIGNKRGAHLSLSLERLEALCGRRLQRVGLSATVEPPAEAARFLVGHEGGGEVRPCALVDAGRRQPMDLQIEVPKETLSAVASRKAWGDVYERLVELTGQHKTTLIFVPSRRLAERVAHDLEEKLGPEQVAAHHGALARRTRHAVERKLKEGSLRAVVATASLELGIDIGHVELVCQLGSPRSIAVLRQRIGRAGHAVGGTPKGRIFAMTRDELLECAAGVRAMRAGVIDRPLIREAPLDVLAQQLVAHCAAEEADLEGLWAMVRRAAPYQALSRAEFEQVVSVLGDGIATRRGRSGAHLHLDRVHGRARGRRGARIAALTSGGAIPDKADYQVVEDPSEALVGTLDEDFAIESMAGDIFLLGSNSWRIRRVENGQVRVEDAHGLPPTIPFWNGEGLARTGELSTEVARLRESLAARLHGPPGEGGREGAIAWLTGECSMARDGAEQAVAYVAEGAQALSAVPTQTCVVAERFFDEAGGMQLVLHAPFGARVNRAFGLALRKRFCRTFDFELQAAATDDGVLLSLGPQHSFPLDSIFGFLHPNTVEDMLVQAALQSPMWETRWRWNATRSLAVLRHSKGRRTPPPLLRMRAADLLAAVFPAQAGCQDNHGGGDLEVPDHPLVTETMRDCLYEAMDLSGLKQVLADIGAGRITCLARDTVAPSPWAHAILNANPYAFLDDAPLEERRSRAVSTTPRPGDALSRDLITIDPTAVEQVVKEAAPAPRDPDELHDLLCTHGYLRARPATGWAELFQALVAAGRAASFPLAGGEAWVAAERCTLVESLFGELPLTPAGVALPSGGVGARIWDAMTAAAEVVGAHLRERGPVTAAVLAGEIGLGVAEVDVALAHLEADGQVLQGRFTQGALTHATAADAVAPIEWCERGLLQRIHRRSLERRRAHVRPVPPAELIRFLFRWQHALPHTRLHGVEGVRRVIEQLEGLELQPATWERDVLAARVEGYRPDWLDELCLSGEVAWARLRVTPPEASEPPEPPELVAGETPRARVTRPRTGAIGLFLRAHAGWLIDPFAHSAERPAEWPHLSARARRVAAELERRGAAFAADLVAALGEPPTEIEGALWELVRTGAVSSDGFAGLRALVAPRTTGVTQVTRPGLAGRWSLLHRDAPSVRATGPFGDGSPVEYARLYLRRYGVVVRDLLPRDNAGPPWRELLGVFRRLEARGEIRGGRFVSGLTGEQFALPEAADALRALPRASSDPTSVQEEAQIAATDPLNLVGILTPGPRVPAVAGQRVLYRDGVPVAQVRELGRA
jgi:ATP-dependent Lhr-like helicase